MVLCTGRDMLLQNDSLPDKKFLVLDTHTMGEPTRIILNGMDPVIGESMMQKKIYMKNNFDEYRRALLLEPRGHADMFGAVLVEPSAENADIGVIFMDSNGYLNMCGHGSIGVATALVTEKMVKVTEPYTNITLDTPSGIIHTKVKVNNGKVEHVSILNVPCFLYKEDVAVQVNNTLINMDIAFGGSFFALVDADKLSLELKPDNLSNLINMGMTILRQVNENVNVKHPYLPITTVDLVEFYSKKTTKMASLKNTVVFGDRQVDRSPCGTGTSAKVAALYSKGFLKINEEFVYESITGSLFTAKVIKETNVGNFSAVVPQITGKAYVTGIHEIILNDDDPFKYGFQLHTI